MADTNRSPDELYAQVEALKARIAELELADAGRQQTEEKLRESEERFKALFDSAPDAMLLADPETGEVLDANAAAAQMLDRPTEEIIGLHQSELHPPRREGVSRITFSEHMQLIQEQGLALAVENAVLRPDGSEVPVEILAQLTRIQGKTVFMGTFRDITQRKRMEKELRESGNRSRAIIEALPDMTFRLDRDGTFLDYSAPADANTYVPPEEFLAKNIADMMPQELVPRFMEHIQQTLDTGKLQSMEYALVVGGQEYLYEARSVIVEEDEQIISIVRDITERKRAEEALWAEKEFSEAIIQASVDTIFVFDPLTGNPFRWNRAFTEISGYTDQEIRAMKAPDDWYAAGDLKHATATVERIFSDGYGTTEMALITKDGNIVPFEYVGSSLKDEDGKLKYIVAVGRNITERRRAEEALRESEERFRRFSAASFEGIVFTDKGVVIDANERVAEMLGCEHSDLLGAQVMDFVAPESRDLVMERIRSEYDKPYDHVAMTKDGSRFHVEVMGQPIPYHGRTARVTILRDITERKRAEEALRQSERKYRLLFENMTTGFALHEMIYDEQGQPADYRYLEINPAFETLTGVPVSALLGKTVKEVLPGTEQYWVDVSAKVAQTGEPIAYQNYARELGRYYDTWLFSPVKDQFAVVFTDVTERVQAENEVKQRNRELAALNDIAAVVSRSLNLDEILGAALDKVLELIQVDAAGIYLVNVEHLKLSLVAHRGVSERFTEELDSISVTQQAIDAAMAQGRLGRFVLSIETAIKNQTELRRIRSVLRQEELRFDSSIPVLLQAKDEILGAMVIASREPRQYSEAELQLLTAIGQQISVAIQNAQLYEEAQHYADDLERRVTERTAELKDANKELEALSRVKDEFVSNVSHELRTPITAIKLYYKLLEEKPDSIGKYLPVLQREAERLHRIIEDLLHLSRLDQERVELNPTAVDLNALVSQYVADRQLLAEEKGLTLSIAGEGRQPVVQADEGLLGQVLGTLLTNALNYTPSGGSVAVATQFREEDGRRWAVFSVSDTGPGVPAGERPQLFERFFRGKVGRASGEPGTGLGLAIASEIVEQHGGHIEITSEDKPGKGATFIVWLPV